MFLTGRRLSTAWPNAQGFDYYFGTLGANDGGRVAFHDNNKQVGSTADMASLTRIYTDKGIEFIKANQKKPFFLYVAHTMVHSVIDASLDFKGKSKGGLYGDTVEEIDHHTGRLLKAIDELGLRDNTIVIFTTDNGPWSNFQEVLSRKHNGAVAWGSSGPLREAKGSTYEGGLRVPCIIRWPGHVPAGRTSDALFSTLDFLADVCHARRIQDAGRPHHRRRRSNRVAVRQKRNRSAGRIPLLLPKRDARPPPRQMKLLLPDLKNSTVTSTTKDRAKSSFTT